MLSYDLSVAFINKMLRFYLEANCGIGFDSAVLLHIYVLLSLLSENTMNGDRMCSNIIMR